MLPKPPGFRKSASAQSPTPSAAIAATKPPFIRKKWKRADKIAASAAIVAIASLVVATLVYIDTHRSNRSTEQISQSALAIAQEAEARSQITDQTAFRAMVMLVGERVNQIVDATEDGEWQLKGIARGSSSELLIHPNRAGLTFVEQLAQRIPSLDLSVDQITTLAKGPSNIAAAVTQCVRMRDQLVTDLQGYRSATFRGRAIQGLDQHQVLAFPVLPDRIEHVYHACRNAATQLTSLIPDQFKESVNRGTVGELMDAQAEAIEERREEERYKKSAKRPRQAAVTAH